MILYDHCDERNAVADMEFGEFFRNAAKRVNRALRERPIYAMVKDMPGEYIVHDARFAFDGFAGERLQVELLEGWRTAQIVYDAEGPKESPFAELHLSEFCSICDSRHRTVEQAADCCDEPPPRKCRATKPLGRTANDTSPLHALPCGQSH